MGAGTKWDPHLLVSIREYDGQNSNVTIFMRNLIEKLNDFNSRPCLQVLHYVYLVLKNVMKTDTSSYRIADANVFKKLIKIIEDFGKNEKFNPYTARLTRIISVLLAYYSDVFESCGGIQVIFNKINIEIDNAIENKVYVEQTGHYSAPNYNTSMIRVLINVLKVFYESAELNCFSKLFAEEYNVIWIKLIENHSIFDESLLYSCFCQNSNDNVIDEDDFQLCCLFVIESLSYSTTRYKEKATLENVMKSVIVKNLENIKKDLSFLQKLGYKSKYAFFKLLSGLCDFANSPCVTQSLKDLLKFIPASTLDNSISPLLEKIFDASTNQNDDYDIMKTLIKSNFANLNDSLNKDLDKFRIEQGLLLLDFFMKFGDYYFRNELLDSQLLQKLSQKCISSPDWEQYTSICSIILDLIIIVSQKIISSDSMVIINEIGQVSNSTWVKSQLNTNNWVAANVKMSENLQECLINEKTSFGPIYQPELFISPTNSTYRLSSPKKEVGSFLMDYSLNDNDLVTNKTINLAIDILEKCSKYFFSTLTIFKDSIGLFVE
ncbi:MAG: hypothetical protein MHPSP_000294 [Paramarteilia canceri]